MAGSLGGAALTPQQQQQQMFNAAQQKTAAAPGMAPAPVAAPAPATNPQWGPQQTPLPSTAQGGTGFSSAGLIGAQGSGIVPVGQQPAASQGGFQTGGYQYGLESQDPIQKSIIDNSGQYNVGAIDPAKMPVGSVQAGDPYMQKMQDAYLAQANRTLDPQWQGRADQMSAQLANQGITPGSEAWNRQMSQFNLGRNDAYGSAQNQAILNSGQEAARMQGMDINAGNFANQAAQQNFTNQLTSQEAQNAALTGQQNASLAAGNFANAAQGQGFQQDLSQAQLNNAAFGQQQQVALGEDVAAKQLAASKLNAQGARASAGAQMQLGMAQLANQTAAQRASAANEARRIDLAQNQQAFDNSYTGQMRQLDYQDRLMGQGVPQNPGLPNPGQMGAGQIPAGYIPGQQAGNALVANGYGTMGGAALRGY
jgi:hypothetical protein